MTAIDEVVTLGLPAFPCREDKSPACPHGHLDATSNPIALRNLLRRYPSPLVGVPTGPASGIDVFDIDAPRHPEAAEWWERHRQSLPLTRVQQTRSGGLHVVFRHEVGLRCWTARPVIGIDGRGDGGYVIWWPVADQPVHCDHAPAAWPQWLLDELSRPRAAAPSAPRTPPLDLSRYRTGSRYADAALRNAVERIAQAPIGSRNSTLNAKAYSLGRLIAEGLLGPQHVADTLASAAIAAGLPPRETEATLRSALGARGVL
jgi:hypothetical protein